MSVGHRWRSVVGRRQHLVVAEVKPRLLCKSRLLCDRRCCGIARVCPGGRLRPRWTRPTRSASRPACRGSTPLWRRRTRRPALPRLGIAWALPAAAPVVATTTASTAIFSRSPWASMSGSGSRAPTPRASKLTRMLSPDVLQHPLEIGQRAADCECVAPGRAAVHLAGLEVEQQLDQSIVRGAERRLDIGPAQVDGQPPVAARPHHAPAPS